MTDNKKTVDITELLLSKTDKNKQGKTVVLDMEEIEFEEKTIEFNDKPIKKGVVDIEDLLAKEVEYTQDLSEDDLLVEDDEEGVTLKKNKSIYPTTDINTLLKQKEGSLPKNNPLLDLEKDLKKMNSDEEETDLQIKNSPTHSLLDLDKQLKKQFFNEKSDVFDIFDEKSIRIIELLKQKKIIEAYQLMESMYTQYENRGGMQLIEYLFRHYVR
ncbi:hypothetical protein JXR93_08135 [bacterium]|nr:hypothetical protein [bacterium]